MTYSTSDISSSVRKATFLAFILFFAFVPIALNADNHTGTVVLPPPGLDVETTGGFDMSGTAFPGSTVVLTTESGARCQVRADASGRFENCTFNKSPVDGEIIIGVIQDTQGNTSQPVQVGTVQVAPNTERSFLREGLFGCAAGEYALPTGTLTAIGGIYVPVNDAAVTLNTGYLVYKECVLDGVIVAMREAATAALVKSSLNYITRGGENGEPLYPTNLKNYYAKFGIETTFENLKDYSIGQVCAPYRQQVRVTLAREHLREVQNRTSNFSCNIGLSNADHQALLRGKWQGWDSLMQLGLNPQNHRLGAYTEAKKTLDSEVVKTIAERGELLSFGNGLISPEQIDQVPTDGNDTRLVRTILTPGYLISRTLEQVAGSGFRQLETASEVDQIINALFSGIGNQILTSVRGLTGLTESNRGNPPYLDQLSSEASARVRQGATNAALTALNSTLATETSYNTIKKNIDTFLDKAISDITSTETRCWELIEEAVKEIAFQCVQTSTETTIDPQTGLQIEREVCVLRQPIPYTVATSTQFSTAALDSEIQPLSEIIKEDVQSSNNAVVLIERLINDVRNTASQTIQRIALEKLDALIGNRAIHTAFDVKSAQEQQPNVESTVGAIVEETIEEWGTGGGWCNVSNGGVVQGWLNAWRTDGV